MDERSIQDCVECLPPTEAFAVLSNETRLAILEELWRAEERPVSFSELRRRVGVRDSAQFNYHLGELTGHFVKKTDGGYDFRYAGKRVVRAVLSGSFNEDPQVPPWELDDECVACGATLEARYEDELLSIECPACGQLHGRYPFPPGGLHDRTEEDVVRAFAERVRHLHCLAADGVCPECNGRMETTIVRGDGEFLGLDVRVVHECRQCRHRVHSSVGMSLLDDAEVLRFHADHGVDLCATPYWRLEWCVSDAHTTVLSEDPWRIEVRMPLEDEELRVTLDGDLTVVETDRRRHRPPAGTGRAA